MTRFSMTCEECQGSGNDSFDESEECPVCNGYGYIVLGYKAKHLEEND